MDRKYTLESVGQKIDCFLTLVTKRAGLKLSYQMSEEAPQADFETPDIMVRFSGPDVEALLENRAELLLALEHVTAEMLRLPGEDHSRICFDAQDYRVLRIEELRLSATAAADRVKRTGQPFEFSPMSSRERRIIHLALNGEKAVRSESAGGGPMRHVVVYPANMPAGAPLKPVARPLGRRRR